MRPAHVAGVGLWAPGFADAAAWLEGRADPGVTAPACAVLPARLKRGTSVLTRVAAEVLAQAAAAGGADLATAATVYGSSNGEIQTAVDILDMMALDGNVSPLRFKNSVHNAAAGHASIAAGNMAFSTSLAAGRRTAAMALLEAMAWLDAEGGEVLVALADEPRPRPIEAPAPVLPLGVAFHLRHERPARGCLGTLAALRFDRACPREDAPAPWRGNPCAGALPLLDALLRGRTGTVGLELDPDDGGWCVDVVRA